MRHIPRCEQETIIRWAADESTATISTSNPAIIRRLDKLTEIAPEAYSRIFELSEIRDARYSMPVKLLRFGKPASEARREINRRNGALLAEKRAHEREKNISDALEG